MLCAKNYCNLLVFGRVIVKIKRGRFFETQCIYLQHGGVCYSGQNGVTVTSCIRSQSSPSGLANSRRYSLEYVGKLGQDKLSLIIYIILLVGGVAQWLGRRSLTVGLSLIYA